MVSTGHAIQALVSQVSELTSQIQRFKVEPTQQPATLNPPAVPDASRTIHSAEPRLPPPTVYSGEPHLCRPFLTKCSLYFSLQPSSFPTEESKVAFAITLLSRRAALWGTMVWDNKHQCSHSRLSQVNWEKFSIEQHPEERRHASWRSYARLAEQLLIILIITVSGKSRSPPVSRRLLAGGFAMERTSRTVTHLPIKIQWDSDMYSCQALIDSGAEGNFLDFTLARKLKVPVFVLRNPISVIALGGQSLSPVTHTTGLIRLVTSGNHTEDIHFLMTNSPSVPVVLSHPWLTVHKPHINWGHDYVLAWSDKWNSADAVFTKLKGCFVSAPILVAPDPS